MQIFVRRNAVVGKSESLMRGACAAFLFSLGFFFLFWALASAVNFITVTHILIL